MVHVKVYNSLLLQKILAFFSGKLRKLLLGKFKGTGRGVKVTFLDFPGGAECFELIARFCYNNGSIVLTPSNIFLLHSAANFLEMKGNIHGIPNLILQTKIYLEGIHYWTWPELVVGLKQCQDLLPVLSSSRLFQEFLDSLVEKLFMPGVASQRTSSSDSSSFQFSGDISSEGAKNYSSQTTWWFQDLGFISIVLLENLVHTMMLQNVEHATICSFLLYYQKARFFSVSIAERCNVTETVVNLICLLDEDSISYRGLLDAFGMTLSLKMSRCCMLKLESLIGSRLDQAKVDDLLVPSPPGKKYAYDSNLILRLVKIFLLKSCNEYCNYRLKKVAGLIDLYIAEVAPDPYLRPRKFAALAMSLPDVARDSHDRLYRAIDMHFEVHRGLCEDEKISVCCALNYNKLSPENVKHLARNPNFPTGLVATASVSLKSKLKTHLKEGHHHKISGENLENLRAKYERRKYKVEEGRKRGRRMAYTMRSRISSSSSSKSRSLPRLCSCGSEPMYPPNELYKHYGT
ncbi:hypothetical protein RJ639_032621 [Escallonia herrerae]|uniref:NPH3 domain-containing protein n=1 Tax=Escallonia herrerae TaxID=1293975 RepID=A0AA88WY54_9ASTE|nr:hypothetical protein RJ639_032621 [Escallonia herrerae]